jgi:hypothetical protein
MKSLDENYLSQIENGTITDRIITLKSIYKTGKRTIQPHWDANSNWWAGVERLSDEEKKERKYYITVGKTKDDARLNTKIVLQDGLTFDLSNSIDALNWKWVKHSQCIAPSFAAAQSDKAEFYVYIAGREAEVSNTKTEQIFEAMQYVMQDPSTNYVNRALLLGIDMSEEPASNIKEYLLDKAKKSPISILRVYRDKSMRINLLFKQAQKENKIKSNPIDGVVKYGETILGVSDESAIAFLQANKDLLEILERDVNPAYFKSKETKKNLTPIEKAREAKKAKETSAKE